MAALRRLEMENQEAAKRLTETVSKGEALLEKIQTILSEIANSQLKAMRLQHLRAVEGTGSGGGGRGGAGGVGGGNRTLSSPGTMETDEVVR